MVKRVVFGILIVGLFSLEGSLIAGAKDQAGPKKQELYFTGSGITVGAAKRYLRSVMPSREEVKDFLSGKQGPEQISYNDGWVFEPDLGWVVCDSVRPRLGEKYTGVYLPYGVGGSRTFYHYEGDGARKVINFADKRCRIHTYGDSFTHCDQVNDGETWQEYLAAHLQEPVRNYGVGGYGVYQAYRRMLKVEQQNGAKYIIFNIYDDDHFRNLDAWRSIRWWYTSPGARWACGYTLPHLRVNVGQDRCEQIGNPLNKAKDVYKLCDEEFVWRTFKDDPVLQIVMAHLASEEVREKLVGLIAASFGVSVDNLSQCRAASEKIWKIHTEAALFATRQVIGWAEEFARENDKELMIILSFSKGRMAAGLRGEARFDQNLLDWLKDKSYPVIDMRDLFAANYKKYREDVDTYLNRYYIGHHNPAGNFFTAWAIKDAVIEWLEPAPLPYR